MTIVPTGNLSVCRVGILGDCSECSTAVIGKTFTTFPASFAQTVPGTSNSYTIVTTTDADTCFGVTNYCGTLSSATVTKTAFVETTTEISDTGSEDNSFVTVVGGQVRISPSLTTKVG
jgi:hypothetical protein